jgi:hypothetical protein
VPDDDDRAGIDSSLRERVTEQIDILTDALNAASADPSDERLDQLQEATDHLMRALGRVLIEIARARGKQESDR